MLGAKELPRHLGAHPGPVRRRHRPIPGQTGRLIDGGDPFRDLDPERADVAVEDLERCPEPGHRQEVGVGQVRSFELLHVAARPAGAYRQPNSARICSAVTGSPAFRPSIPAMPGPDPHPGLLAAFGVVGGQPGVALLGRIQRRHLPGQIVIPRPGGELVHTHRHTPLKAIPRARRSRRPGGTFRRWASMWQELRGYAFRRRCLGGVTGGTLLAGGCG